MEIKIPNFSGLSQEEVMAFFKKNIRNYNSNGRKEKRDGCKSIPRFMGELEQFSVIHFSNENLITNPTPDILILKRSVVINSLIRVNFQYLNKFFHIVEIDLKKIDLYYQGDHHSKSIRNSLNNFGYNLLFPIILIKINGRFLLADGHHRLKEMLLVGELTIPSVIFEEHEFRRFGHKQ